MLLFLLRPRMAMMLLISCLAVGGVSSAKNIAHVLDAEHTGTEEGCPPCELLFSKLERNGKDGKLAQDIRVQERGEPKTGTGIMYFWSVASLNHACAYLRGLYGEESCRINSHQVDTDTNRYFKSMVFEPSLGIDGRCSCETIDRVSISTSDKAKHTLPVTKSCAFSHGGGIGLRSNEKPRESPCTFPDGSHVNNNADLWRCMHEADCEITDHWLQMAILRDPRPAIVSTFFHAVVHSNRKLGDLEAFVARELPIICQWLSVRYILFAGILAHQSIEFWYEDAMDDPLGWHYHWFNSVGLQLPFDVVEETAQAAADNQLGFKHKDVDLHPGEEERTEEGVRLFENEVSPETLELASAVLRTWLPPILLERFGVEP